MYFTPFLFARSFCQTRCCLFGAGVMLGGVKKVSLPKITYSSWQLNQATLNQLTAIHHPLVTQYFLRLDGKRAALEAALQQQQQKQQNEEQQQYSNKLQHLTSTSADTSKSNIILSTNDKMKESKANSVSSDSSSSNNSNNKNVSTNTFDLIKWNKRYCNQLQIAQKLSKLLRQLNESVTLREQLLQKKDHTSGEGELLEMVVQDISAIKQRIHNLDEDVNTIISHRLNVQDVIGSSSKTWKLTVTGKAGGEEAGLFASELAEMFKSYAKEIRNISVREVNDWETDQSDADSESNDNINISVKSANASNSINTNLLTSTGKTLLLTGNNVYRYFHHEIGVHKVQRIPVTDSSGKMQTSTACVTLMPQLDPLSVNVREQDCKIDYVRGSGPGGQGMQSSSNCVVLQHLPTGICVKCHQSRSALGNKELALQYVARQILTQRVKQQQLFIHSAWENQWSSGERSEKMRTYNFPQNRVTDHRLGRDYSLANFMEGGKGLQEVHDALNEINELHELTNVLLKHINDNFSGTVA